MNTNAINNININPITAGSLTGRLDQSGSAVDADFKKVLSDFIKEANISDYNDKVNNISLMSGDDIALHDAVISAQKADLSLRLAIQIRNKAIDAYNEIMRMQI